MTDDPLFSKGNKWFVGSVAVATAVFVFSAGMGLVALPFVQVGPQITGLWDLICSAAGVPRKNSSDQTATPSDKLSTVVIAKSQFLVSPPDSIGRGATLAQQCAICHGPTGVSLADSPNLAGQYASAIYKQLRDFKSGARSNAVMSPFVKGMSEQDMEDLAAYYAFLPRLPGYHPKEGNAVPQIVQSGAPMRGIAPCGACHGDIESKTGSPWLQGQSVAYIKAQLQAFVDGQRSNDISQQMRNVARQMTDSEIDQAATYFSSRPASTAD